MPPNASIVSRWKPWCGIAMPGPPASTITIDH
jgi:hypothetical protein